MDVVYKYCPAAAAADLLREKLLQTFLYGEQVKFCNKSIKKMGWTGWCKERRK